MLLTINDVLWGIVLTLWVMFVTLYLSKIIANKTTIYVARKSIHMLGGGIVAVISPYVFSSPFLPIILSYLLSIYLLFHRKGKMLDWFQDKENQGEVYFTFSFGTILLISWLIMPNFWDPGIKYLYVALLPLLYMAFGDGVTGIIRNYVYKKRVKGLWGSVGMLVVCASLGYFLLSIYGLISGVIATIVERLGKVDDNILVPFVSFLFLLLTVKFL
ncbi:phosphatidate cytidylyltransferase [Acidianus sulfidivorans JP7]|uniref:Phosphatidate cytidylyltransferase n=1 Tax=Acidianus sulfidivorans JP7 TaxID=619593 RepID=A0A2U9IK81_9CREN|nr:phosphatidate cytidylyltransferase [Acidianus sulfidivorans]AWR96447.1 phosphatidate cytidylyltransferase [Acidianus sulfidivorans JP7]